MLIKLWPPMQSPKSPVYRAGYRSTSKTCSTPAALVPIMVAGALSARTHGSMALMSVKEDTSPAVHDPKNKGKRAIVEMATRVIKTVETRGGIKRQLRGESPSRANDALPKRARNLLNGRGLSFPLPAYSVPELPSIRRLTYQRRPGF
jgi:hypothetical protein